MALLPTPIEHPLSYFDAPGWMREALNWVIGVDWPEGNEKAMRDLALDWRAAQREIAPLVTDADRAALRAVAALGGPERQTAQALLLLWDALGGGSDDGGWTAIEQTMVALAESLAEGANSIEGVKIEYYIELGILLIELVIIAVTMAFTFGASAAAAMPAMTVTRFIIQMILKRATRELLEKAVKRTIKDKIKDEVLHKVKSNAGRFLVDTVGEALEEAAQEFLTSVGVQVYQVSEGNKAGIDWKDAGMSGLYGAVGGAVANVTSLGGKRSSTVAGGFGENALRGAGGEILAEVAVAGLSGQGLTWQDVGMAGTSAISGSTLGDSQRLVNGELAAANARLDGRTADGLTNPNSGNGPANVDPQPAPAFQPLAVPAGDDVAATTATSTGGPQVTSPAPADVSTDNPTGPITFTPLVDVSPIGTDAYTSPTESVSTPSAYLPTGMDALTVGSDASITASQTYASPTDNVSTTAAQQPTAATPIISYTSDLTTHGLLAGVATMPDAPIAADPPGVAAASTQASTAPTSAGSFPGSTSTPSGTAPLVAPAVSRIVPPPVVVEAPQASSLPSAGVRPPTEPNRPSRQPFVQAQPTMPYTLANPALRDDPYARQIYAQHINVSRLDVLYARLRERIGLLLDRLRNRERSYENQIDLLHQELGRLDDADVERIAQIEAELARIHDRRRAIENRERDLRSLPFGTAIPNRVTITDQNLLERLNRDMPHGIQLARGGVNDGDTSAISNSGTRPVEASRRYYEPGGHTEPNAQHQQDVELVIPRDAAGHPAQYPDILAPWRTLANDGGAAADPCRAINGIDVALSLHDTWTHARPRVAAPRMADTFVLSGHNAFPVGLEPDGFARIERETGGAFQRLAAPPLNLDLSDNPDWVAQHPSYARASYRRLESAMLKAQHGAFAFISVRQTVSAQPQIFVAVNQAGTIYYVDAADPAQPPMTRPPVSMAMSALVLDPHAQPLRITAPGNQTATTGPDDEDPPTKQLPALGSAGPDGREDAIQIARPPGLPVDRRPTLGDLIPRDQADVGRLRGPAFDAVAARLNGNYAGLHVRVNEVALRVDQLSVKAKIFDHHGNEIGRTNRSFNRGSIYGSDQLWAYHALLSLDRPFQGQGFAKAWNAHLEEWYRDSGVAFISVTANIDVGGYTWARQGFDFADEDGAREIATRLQRLSGRHLLTAEVLNEVDAMIIRLCRPFGEEGFPKAAEVSQLGKLWHHAGRDDSWPGKQAMMGSRWKGIRWLNR